MAERDKDESRRAKLRAWARPRRPPLIAVSGAPHLSTAERLVNVQQLRSFELWLSTAASAIETPCLAWAAARTAYPATEGATPIVVILLGIQRRAWWFLGVLHVLAYVRARRALGRVRSGYRLRILVTT